VKSDDVSSINGRLQNEGLRFHFDSLTIIKGVNGIEHVRHSAQVLDWHHAELEK